MKVSNALIGLASLGTSVVGQNSVDDIYSIIKPKPTGTKYSFGVRAGLGVAGGLVASVIQNILVQDLAAIAVTLEDTEIEPKSKDD